jgi:hypothetical protein
LSQSIITTSVAVEATRLPTGSNAFTLDVSISYAIGRGPAGVAGLQIHGTFPTIPVTNRQWD